MLDIDVGWVNGPPYQRILFHSVRTASADRVREMAAPRRHLALVCFLHQAWRGNARAGRRHVLQAARPPSQAGRGPPRRHAQSATPRRRPDRSPLPTGSARCCSILTSATPSCGFLEEAEAGTDAPVPDLLEEVVRQILAALVHPQGQPAGDGGVHRAVPLAKAVRDGFEGGEPVADPCTRATRRTPRSRGRPPRRSSPSRRPP